MDITPNGGGGSRVRVTLDRTAANPLGRINLAVIGLGGKRLLGWATRKSLSDAAKAYGEDSPRASLRTDLRAVRQIHRHDLTEYVTIPVHPRQPSAAGPLCVLPVP